MLRYGFTGLVRKIDFLYSHSEQACVQADNNGHNDSQNQKNFSFRKHYTKGHAL